MSPDYLLICAREILRFGSVRAASRDDLFVFKIRYEKHFAIPVVQLGPTGTGRLYSLRETTPEFTDESEFVYLLGSELGSEDAIRRALTPFAECALAEEKRWKDPFTAELKILCSHLDKQLSRRERVGLEYELTMTTTKVDLKDQDDIDGVVEGLTATARLDPMWMVVEPAMVQALEIVPHDQLDAEEQCAICTDEYRVSGGESLEVARLPCSHKFHAHCIGKWFFQKHGCPICRFRMPHMVIAFMQCSLVSFRPLRLHR